VNLLATTQRHVYNIAWFISAPAVDRLYAQHADDVHIQIQVSYAYIHSWS